MMLLAKVNFLKYAMHFYRGITYMRLFLLIKCHFL